MRNNKIELKPCPFCGRKTSYEENYMTSCYIRCDEWNSIGYIGCGASMTQRIGESKEQLFERWNKRV